MSTRKQVIETLRAVGHYDLAVELETAVGVANNGDAILFDNEWLGIRETPDGYIYMHQNKSNGQGVAVLAYREGSDGLEIVGRYERVPCHRDGFALCALTGMMETDETPVDVAVRELKEESGIDAEASEMESLGTVRNSKASDTTMHLFGIDVGDRDIGEIVGDGTFGEEGAYCRWVTVGDAVGSKDPLLATLVARKCGVGGQGDGEL